MSCKPGPSKTCRTVMVGQRVEKKEEEKMLVMMNGRMVANQYELVRTIFTYLPWRDLETCAKVCKLWKNVFDICVKEKTRYDSASFYWSGKCSDVSYYSKYELFQSPHHHQLYTDLGTYMAELPIKPKLAIIFGTGDTEISVRDSSPGLEPEDHMERSWLVDKAGMLARLPPDCITIATTSRGLVGTSQGSPVELENLYPENNLLTPAVSMLLVPEKPGVKMLPFHLAEHQLDPLIADINKDSPYLESEPVLQQALLDRAVPGLKPEDKVKAVILLSNGLDLPFSMHIIQAVSVRTGGKVAIGGAVGDLCWSSEKDTSMLALMRELFYFNYQTVPVAENSYMSTSGFIIAGDQVEAASVMLTRKVRSEKKVLAELQRLKDCGVCEENSFAFMFACCGRGENHYRGKVGLESAAFHKLFPKTPLVGVFGNGEIGVSHLPRYTGASQSANPAPTSPGPRNIPSLKPGQFLHSFTTVFVLISTGNC